MQSDTILGQQSLQSIPLCDVSPHTQANNAVSGSVLLVLVAVQGQVMSGTVGVRLFGGELSGQQLHRQATVLDSHLA